MAWVQLTNHTDRQVLVNLDRVDSIIFYDQDFIIAWGTTRWKYPKTKENLSALNFHVYLQGDV